MKDALPAEQTGAAWSPSVRQSGPFTTAVGGLMLLIPGFISPAAAPLAYAIIIERFESAGALYYSIAAALLAFASAALLVVKSVG